MSRITNLLINIGSDDRSTRCLLAKADVSGRWAAVRSVSAGIHAAGRVGPVPGWPEIVWRKKVYSKSISALPSHPSQALTVEEEP